MENGLPPKVKVDPAKLAAGVVYQYCPETIEDCKPVMYCGIMNGQFCFSLKESRKGKLVYLSSEAIEKSIYN